MHVASSSKAEQARCCKEHRRAAQEPPRWLRLADSLYFSAGDDARRAGVSPASASKVSAPIIDTVIASRPLRPNGMSTMPLPAKEANDDDRFNFHDVGQTGGPISPSIHFPTECRNDIT